MQDVQSNTFRSDHKLVAIIRFSFAHDQWPDTVRIAKRYNAVTDNHRDDGIAARTAFVESRNCLENLLRCRLSIGPNVQFVGEYVE